jgi:hypothetical protein
MAMNRHGFDADVLGDPGKSLEAPSITARVAAVAADPTVRVVVIATASNDNIVIARRSMVVSEARALDEYGTLADHTIAELGDRCIVLVGVRDKSSPIYQPDFARATNARLATLMAAHRNVRFVDWATISRSHSSDWFAPDLLHFADFPTGSNRHEGGAMAYAAAIADGAATCPASAPSVSLGRRA